MLNITIVFSLVVCSVVSYLENENLAIGNVTNSRSLNNNCIAILADCSKDSITCSSLTVSVCRHNSGISFGLRRKMAYVSGSWNQVMT